MARRDTNPGCVVVYLLILWGVVSIIYNVDNFFHPERDEKKKADFISEWKQSNIDFFKNFECPIEGEFKISNEENIFKKSKVYVFWTNKDINCRDIREMFSDFSNSRFGIHRLDLSFRDKKLDRLKTDEINKSDVFIWVRDIPGNQEGTYSGGSRAIRLNSEINFVKTSTKEIVKKVIIKNIGEPLDKVREGYTEKPKDYYFGIYSLAGISNVVENELYN